MPFVDIDECSDGSDNCDQTCTNTDGSFTCSCGSGFTLDADGHSCTADPIGPLCGGLLTAASGSFQTPDWPTSYPFENFQCEWFIELPNSAATIEFTIDDSAFGIKGRPPCTTNHIEFFDGTGNSAPSLNKICGVLRFYDDNLPVVTTSSSLARVVFTGTDESRQASRVGVKVDYRTIQGRCMHSEHIHTPITIHSTLYFQFVHHLCYITADVDECLVNNGGCSQLCVDTADSFECACNAGFSLEADGTTCTGKY